ncbi:MAG: carboxypeptidase regulatory-like domain-containing protein, partial [Pyrinomonadaceae bacterium]
MRKIFSWAGISSGSTTLAAALALFLLTPIVGLAQSDNAQVSGFVRDPAGAVTPNVKVVIKSEEREFERTTTTNEEGYFVISNVSPGFYTVSAEASGFKRFEVTNKKVDPGIAATVDIALQTGEVSETVSVIAETAAIQTESATVGKLVEAKQIQYMQLNGRNPLFLALLKPGVAGGALGGFTFGLTSGGFNINGSRGQDNLITFDGAVAVRTRSNGTSIGVADVDATQEVQILTANYNAEYGRSSGGQIRIVTKSGTRDFHGTAYEYVRNSAFDANSWGRKRTNPGNQPCDDERFKRAIHCRPDPFRYNQFGYSLNGPVILPFTKFNRERDKLFWLFGQEWVRQRRAATTQITVPSLAMRQGNFSELLSSNRFFSGPRVIRDPQLTGRCEVTPANAVAGVNYQEACFPGNIIPTNRLSSNGIGFLNALPAPTVGFIGPGSSNFFQERPTLTNQRKDTLSIDFYPTENHQIRGRLQNYNFLDVSAFRGGTDRAPQIIDRPNQTVSIGWTWTISPTWINEALIAGSRDQVFISVDTEGERYRRSIYGINYDYIFDAQKEIQDKIPTVEIQNFASLDGGPYPASSTGPIYQFSNNVTNIRGNHTIKFGG